MNSSTTSPSVPERPRLVVLRGEDLPPGHERIDDHPRLGEVVYATADELSATLPGADVLLVWDLFTEALADSWSKADSLKWVHAATTGVDNLMFPGLVESDVLVTNSRGVFDEHIAEYVLGLVISFAKDFQGTWDLQRERQWRHRETERVAGRRVLVVGTGPIGRAIARKLTAVGMDVRGSGSHARDGDPDFGSVAESSLAEPGADGGRTLLDELPEADYVVVAAPLTESTRGLVGREFLDLMKPTARLVNIARGPIVVQSDLVAALDRGAIAGAALDVFEREPLKAINPLWGLPGSVVSPHMSGDVVGWREDLVELFLDNLARYLDGRGPRNVVDKSRGYVPG
ncbi:MULTISPECIES: D-2-hydroxyacid dehydrogenase [unclassified Nocardiopsis]|uniref:D-2-hydroxyacid dehydrogenase n=1 Tax=unclassified Nocardiopsis TaxID=2649073 RepID=UPI00066CF9B3|nr:MULTISPECIES: D-2-hydroxyacid dehydrogenase [unclassified Nocardiopsis]MBQ1081851.1 D-2-hydroxyacid dehydrogenase [Nocardiopsis sp. B62]